MTPTSWGSGRGDASWVFLTGGGAVIAPTLIVVIRAVHAREPGAGALRIDAEQTR